MKFIILKHVLHEGPGLFQEYLDEQGYAYQVVELERGEPIPTLQKGELLVCMGGPMNVYQEEDYPFLAEEDRLIKQVLTDGRPFLGFCLGSQLLAKAAGAKVTENLWKEIGNFPVRLTEAGRKDPLFEGFDAEFPVFQWHGDTFEIPERGENLAESEGCKHQVLKMGKKAYGLQFHLEISAEMLEEWFVLNEQEVFEEQLDPTAIMDRFRELEGLYKSMANQLFDNFIGIAEGV